MTKINSVRQKLTNKQTKTPVDQNKFCQKLTKTTTTAQYVFLSDSLIHLAFLKIKESKLPNRTKTNKTKQTIFIFYVFEIFCCLFQFEMHFKCSFALANVLCWCYDGKREEYRYCLKAGTGLFTIVCVQVETFFGPRSAGRWEHATG